MGDERGTDAVTEVAVAVRGVERAVARVRGSARSPDGAVFVEAGVDGRIATLDLGPGALRLGADGLARLIVELHAEAAAEAAAAAESLRAGLLTDPRVARVLALVDVARVEAVGDEPDPDPDRYYSDFSVFGADPTPRG